MGIMNFVQTKMQNQDHMDFENKVETLAALRIMNTLLGEEWYKKAGNWSSDKKPGTVESSRPHPISQYLGTGKPDDIIKLIGFANFLKNLYCKSNVQEKLRDYVRKEKRTEIQTTPFDKIYFELKSANYYAQKNFYVEFMKERKGIRTPDLKIIGKDGYVYLECKRKEERKEYSINGVIDSIRRAYEQLREQDMGDIISVELPMRGKVPSIELSSLIEQIHLVFPELPMASYVIILGEGTWKDGEKIRLTTISKSIPNPYSKKLLPHSIEEVTKIMNPAKEKSLLED